jgi:ureidoglycolate hydrolase
MRGPVWQGMMISIVSSNRKVPDLRTLGLFRSGLQGLSSYLHVNNTHPLGTQTFSTRERPTALGACVPSDKDGLNPSPSHKK